MNDKQTAEELIEQAATATIEQQAALAKAQRQRQDRAAAIWQLRQSTGWSSAKIARKLQQSLRDRGVTEIAGIGVSHDNVRRVVEGPAPVD